MENITHPWQIASWPTVRCPSSQRGRMISRLQCLSAHVSEMRNGRPYRGQVMWACETAQGTAGLAWDWFEVRANVVAMADPMHVLSNVAFVDDLGQDLPEPARLIELNNLVAGLDWQGFIEPSSLRAANLQQRAAA
jgi:hypothetical protein